LQGFDFKLLSDKVTRLQSIIFRMDETLLNERLDIATKVAHLSKQIDQASQVREEIYLMITNSEVKKIYGHITEKEKNS